MDLNVLLFYYSSTGNTKYVGEIIGNYLSANFSFKVSYFDCLPLIKALHLGQKDGSITLPSEKPKELLEFEFLLSQTNIIGIGSYAYVGTIGPGMYDIFSVVSPSLFLKIKYSFAYVTFGNYPGETLNVLATILTEKVPGKYLGGVGVRTPENSVIFLPMKPYRDMWDNLEIRKGEEFAKYIASQIISPEKLENKEYTDFKRAEFIVHERFLKKNEQLGSVILNELTCIGCGKCVNVCPYNAITLDKKFPIFNHDLCWGCGRCFNLCPSESIGYKNILTDQKSRYPSPLFEFKETKTDYHGSIYGEDAKEKQEVIGVPLPPGNVLLERFDFCKKK